MKILVNALSTTNMSGRYVLLGFLRRLSRWTVGVHDFVVLYHQGNAGLREDVGDNVTWLQASFSLSPWWFRAAWEELMLERAVRAVSADLLLHTSGMVARRSTAPQVSLAMNPWCLVPGVQRRLTEKLKAALQRKAYRNAVKHAAMMIYLSAFLRDAYHANAGRPAKRSVVAHAGLSNDLLERGRHPTPLAQRRDSHIVSVSAMAAHKGVDLLLRAMQVLRRARPNATLDLIGPWPERAHEQAMRRRCRELGLDQAVRFRGYVDRELMLADCAGARVFCLMSRCESFGIPGLEAQALGTPVVCSNCCAMPEIYGDGAICPDQDDVDGTAAALLRLLSDDIAWQSYSDAASENARKYDFDVTTRSIMEMFDL